MTAILERARAADPPTVATQYGSDEIRLLVALCRELQREVDDGPFYLATTTVAKLFGLRDSKGNWNRMRAWRWLQGLVPADAAVSVTVEANPGGDDQPGPPAHCQK